MIGVAISPFVHVLVGATAAPGPGPGYVYLSTSEPTGSRAVLRGLQPDGSRILLIGKLS